MRDIDAAPTAGWDAENLSSGHVRPKSIRLRFWVVATVYGVLLNLTTLTVWLSGLDEFMLQLSVLSILIPMALQCALLPLNVARSGRVFYISFAFLFLVIISDFNVRMSYLVLIQFANLLLVFAAAGVVASCAYTQLFKAICGVYSIVGAAILAYVNLFPDYLWGRLVTGGMTPNFWGLIGFTVALTALAFRRLVIAAFCASMGLFTLYSASSRGAIFAVLIAGLCVIIVASTTLRSPHLSLWLGIGAGSTLIVLFSYEWVLRVLPGLLDDVLKINDPYRGLGSGFSGRMPGWEETLEIWLSSPVFGVGYRQHELLLTLNKFSSENAYLSMLADLGILGLALYVWLIIASTGAALRIPDRRTRLLAIAMVIGYATLGLAERRALNSGNPASILFVFACFHTLTNQRAKVQAPDDSATLRRVPR